MTLNVTGNKVDSILWGSKPPLPLEISYLSDRETVLHRTTMHNEQLRDNTCRTRVAFISRLHCPCYYDP